MERLLAVVFLTAISGWVNPAVRPPAPAGAEEAPLATQVASPNAPADAVVLITIDGARWQDVFAGAMPRLDALVATRGAALGAPGVGEPMHASGPNFVSLPGYAEIFTGRAQARCRDNECTTPEGATLADDVIDSGGEAAVFASWERIVRVSGGRGKAFVSAGRHGRSGQPPPDPELARQLRLGTTADASPGHGDYRPDRLTAAAALRYLDLRHPDLLVIALGDPDEHAHNGNRPAYEASLRAADDTVGDVVEHLEASGQAARTTVLVTSDHGRAANFRDHGARYPESSRVWLAAFGPGVRARGRVGATATRHLADVAPTVRWLLGLHPEDDASTGQKLSELLR